MAKHSAFLDAGAWNGVQRIFHRDHDGEFAVESRQDVQPILDANKEAQNHCNPNNADGSMRMVARIPLIVITKWRNELGVDFWNPDHQDKVHALLNSSEWKWLRTDDSVI